MIQLHPVFIASYYAALTLVGLVLRIFFRFRVVGRKNLIKGGRGFVLAANHPGSISPLFVVAARGLIQKKMLIMGDADLYRKFPGTKWFWNLAGVFPVVRGTGNREMVNRVRGEVAKGRGLLIFPEGGVSPKGRLGHLKSGAFVVAMEAGVPLIPCLVQYKAGWPRPFTRVTVAFGQPVTLEELGLGEGYSAARLREAKTKYTALLMQLHKENFDTPWNPTLPNAS